uniref:RNA (guanine-9-)-methyltransferase domain-containing protein 1 n=1 Tax=Lygus hesperus TaxID=30085 RepID=A0A0A9VVC1_LYGHE
MLGKFRKLLGCGRCVLVQSGFIPSKPVNIPHGVALRSLLSTKVEDAPVDLFQNVDYDTLTEGDENLLKKLKLIMLEVDVMRQEGHAVPTAISTERWRELLIVPSRSQRMKQLRFWAINEKKKSKDKDKKARKRQERLALLDEQQSSSDEGHIKYGFNGSTIFLRIYDSAIDKWKNSRLVEAMMFGQPLVIDCSYEKYMNIKEASNSALQLSYVFAENRAHVSPFNVHFCNADRNGLMMSKLHKMIPTLYNDDFPVNVIEKSYLDVFPKEKLVYLTPHCREELLTYNHDDVYIIGAMVDKVNNEPLSLAKAKAEGLRMAKLPLDRYLDWGMGTKSLTINQVMSIMLDMKVTNNWPKALKHVPQRKIKEENEKRVERTKKSNKFSIRQLYR